MTQESLKLALEALEDRSSLMKWQIARDAVKEALAQHDSVQAKPEPQQEPVATDWERIARVQNAKLRAMCEEKGGFEKLCEIMDKYEKTTPPQRTWVGLTDEDVERIVREARVGEHGIGYTIAKAIQAELKQKNGFAEEKNT